VGAPWARARSLGTIGRFGAIGWLPLASVYHTQSAPWENNRVAPVVGLDVGLEVVVGRPF
jgi:hypothetical protein